MCQSICDEDGSGRKRPVKIQSPVNVSVTWPVPMRVLSADLSVADPVLCQRPLRVQTRVVVNAGSNSTLNLSTRLIRSIVGSHFEFKHRLPSKPGRAHHSTSKPLLSPSLAHGQLLTQSIVDSHCRVELLPQPQSCCCPLRHIRGTAADPVRCQRPPCIHTRAVVYDDGVELNANSTQTQLWGGSRSSLRSVANACLYRRRSPLAVP
jgi:hypothetical protein